MNFMHFSRVGASVIALATISGCTLPRSGPDDRAIEAQATVRVSGGQKKQVGTDYALVDLTKFSLPFFEEEKKTSIRDSFGGGSGGAPDIPLGFGDVVQVSIFESQAGGLFVPADAGSRPGNYITLPNQTIDRNGTISVPYAGRVRAAGQLKEQVERNIEDLLANRAIEPQVVLSTVSRKSSLVAVLGDVNQPTKLELTPAGDRILDAISEAGGLSTPAIETNVTLQRRGKTATVSYQTLLDNPRENIFLAPEDTVFANHERRTFLAFGAAGASGRFDFADSNLTLGEGLAKAGGLRDDRADPAQVMLYRFVEKSTLQKMGANVQAFTGEMVPTILRVSLKDPSGLFVAQQFVMRDKDVIYISNSDSVELLKFLDIVNSVTTTAAGTTSDAVTTRDAIRELR